MSIFSLLYQMIIGPLELLFEVVYQISYKIIGNPGLAIIPVSLAINFLCLPLYLRADSIQKENREKEKSMSSWVNHIKTHFKGDEQYMMLQAYYRVKHYNPIYTLRNSFSLLLQIPFFIAAYHFLSNLETLKGTSFGIIADLGAPDVLLTVGGISINVLPILMTAVNLVSSSVYSKNTTARDKIQLYGLALIFLVLLYRSPAGLVFYWLLNNIFSLLKNMALSLPQPKRILKTCLACFGVMIIILEVSEYILIGTVGIPLAVFGAVFILPLLFFVIGRKHNIRVEGFEIQKSNIFRFELGCVVMAVLTGMLIPSAVVASSPMEFITLTNYQSPLNHVLNASLLSFGTFVFWLGIFYYLMKEKARSITELILWIVIGLSVVNYMAFGGDMGTLSPVLQYKGNHTFTTTKLVVNWLTCVLVATIFLLLWTKKVRLIKDLCILILVVTAGMSIRNVFAINAQIPAMKAAVQNVSEQVPTLPLSKTGKNVVVLVLDKAVNSFVPYMFNERPRLAEQFEGFTYYPNTISYGNMTNVGSPGLYGGYEYTPEEMNKRSNEWLGDKQNEALKIMPVMFDEAGYDVTVCDPPYAGYQNLSDLTIYDKYPEIRAFLTDKGAIRQLTPEYIEIKERLWKRNFFCYSLMKIVPLMMQDSLYQDGSYFYSNATDFMQVDIGDGTVKSVGGQEEFMNSYAVLNSLPDLCEVTDNSVGSFIMIHNLTPHAPVFLQEPDYTPEVMVDNEEYDREHADRFNLNGRILHTNDDYQITHYHANMAALIQVGNWLDYLRENGLYDNTRIIIVADHGAPLKCFDDMQAGGLDVMYINPLLMVKDYNDNESFREDIEFMTNADTPALAFKGLIDEPTNPFTGKTINSQKKLEEEQHILITYDWQVDVNNGNVFLPGDWYSLRGQDIFDMKNWSYLGKY